MARALGTVVSAVGYEEMFDDSPIMAEPMPPKARQTSKGMGEVQNPQARLEAITNTLPPSHTRLGPLSSVFRSMTSTVE